MTTFQQLKTIIILPFSVTIGIPFILLISSFMIPFSLFFPFGIAFFSISLAFNLPFSVFTIIVGLSLIGIGSILMIITIRLFSQAEGTLAPWDPPKKFVVNGIYRYVRNPMITGVLIILLGESILLGSFLVFTWFLFFGIMNHFYFIFSEEPNLEKRFGEEYKRYKQEVPRWIPRLRAWDQE